MFHLNKSFHASTCFLLFSALHESLVIKLKIIMTAHSHFFVTIRADRHDKNVLNWVQPKAKTLLKIYFINQDFCLLKWTTLYGDQGFFFPELQKSKTYKKTASRNFVQLHSSLFRYKSWVKLWSFGNKSGCIWKR